MLYRKKWHQTDNKDIQSDLGTNPPTLFVPEKLSSLFYILGTINQ